MNDRIHGGCTGKQSFPDRGKALAVLRRRQISRARGRGKVAPYQCNICGAWHLGSAELDTKGKTR